MEKNAFVVKKSVKNLTVPETFNLNTEHRAEQRSHSKSRVHTTENNSISDSNNKPLRKKLNRRVLSKGPSCGGLPFNSSYENDLQVTFKRGGDQEAIK